MHDVIVRAETADDVKAIDVVNLSAFEGEAEARLVDAVRNSEDFIRDLSLVAEINGRIVGHLLLSKVLLDSALIQAAIGRARDMRYGAIVVAGQPEYYRRFDFRPAAEWGVTSNLPIPHEALSAMELIPGALSGGGKVIYPPPFSEIF